MKILLTADLHLVDTPSCEYRWGVFPWMAEIARKHGVDAIYICGDITDKKDNHSSDLVNRLMDALHDLTAVAQVMVLKGNHDYIKEDKPFFRIANKLGGATFVSEPTKRGNLLLLPHTRTPEKDWEDLDFDEVDCVFMHQPVIGAVASDSYEIEHGLNASWFEGKGCAVYSGDIHVPQSIGCVSYIGAPYRINFGDSYQGQVIILNTCPEAGEKAETIIPFESLQRHTLTCKDPEDLRDADLRKGDQVKIKIRIPKSSFHEWHKKKKLAVSICQELGVEVFGIKLVPVTPRVRLFLNENKQLPPTKNSTSTNPNSVLLRFAKKEGLTEDLLAYGKELVQTF